ncbi:MAG: hypothetical protein LPK19_14970 [Hymenobacteraceae bacterium]|nr:hypothetical protein [Hymenobacteraceae bacterium]MDX5397536.1 hypothetical protein [Hymenobacteraceae bacterium]MDX5513614.1 hypothetical protein [Hymenobacteraceae bacterium]
MKQIVIFIWLTLLLFLLNIFGVNAQNGAWTPTGANYSYPRTLLKASDLPAVQQSLTTPDIYTLYSGVYSNGSTAVPAINSTSNERRARAQKAKNAAFILLLDRKPAGSNTVEPLTATQRTQLETNLLLLLENINTAVENSYSYTEWQWRSKELIDYLIAYDLMRGAGVSETTLAASKAKLQLFASNLYTESTKNAFIVGVFFNTAKNNHALMTAAALGMAAVVLNDATGTTASQQPQSWINVGLYHIDNVLWHDAKRQSIPGVVAGYAEGPYYFKYAFLNCLPFIRAMGHFLPDMHVSCTWSSTTRSIRNPWHDPNYDNLYSWAAAILMPDGRLPALEDSYIDMGMPELALTGKPQHVRQMNFSKFETGQLNSLNKQLADVTVDMRAAYIAANINTTVHASEASLTALPESGNLVFRSGSGQSNNIYLHIYGKNGSMLSNSGGHNQGDAGSFMLHAYGQLLALDPGYLSYSRRSELGNAYNHNLI